MNSVTYAKDFEQPRLYLDCLLSKQKFTSRSFKKIIVFYESGYFVHGSQAARRD
jgi:hypothetical protein